jgi:hypothetical protein
VAWKARGTGSRPRYLLSGIKPYLPIHCAHQCLDENQEPPETPAPVFAARALKSALFGTPAPLEDDDNYEYGNDAETMAGNDIKRSLSPTKPQGILLTPGTATTRRKTVSFGNEVLDKAEKNVVGRASKSGIPDDCPGKFPSPWPAEEKSTKPTRKTTLTQTLEKARESKLPRTSSESNRASPESQQLLNPKLESDTKTTSTSRARPRRSIKPQKSNQELLQELVENDPVDCDMTMDLNEPHSQSGKFWKSEYEHYHQEAKREMEKLLRYKQLAKSYAKKRDAEAIDLSEKLKEEQKRVINMEDKISELTALIACAGSEGNEDDTPELIKELARQTALAMQYKSQVEEFRTLLEGSDVQAGKTHDGKRFTSPRTEQTLLDTHRELKKAREQLREMSSLREELQNVRQSLSAEEKKNAKLQEENTKLTQELLHADLRLERHLEKSEKKRQSFEEQREKRDEALQNLQKDYDKLKEIAKSQRRDAEQLLKKRHDQAVEFRKEIASLRSAESNAQERLQGLLKKASETEKTVVDYQKQIEELKGGWSQEPKADKPLKERKEKKLPSQPLEIISSNPASDARDSMIPVSTSSISRPAKALASSKQNRSDTPTNSPRRRSSHSALSEIINNATVDSTPPQRAGPVHHTPFNRMTPLANRFSSMSLHSPDLKSLDVQLPSPEPSLPQINPEPNIRAVHERNCHISPQPSIFNLASSPPKVAMVRFRGSDEISGGSNENAASHRYPTTSSSRLSSMDGSRTRRELPPERAAAAKARLEQKNAEKKRAQAMGRDKENIRE